MVIALIIFQTLLFFQRVKKCAGKSLFTVRERKKWWGIRRNSEPQYLLNTTLLLPCVTNIAIHIWNFSLQRRIELLSFSNKTQTIHKRAIMYFWILLVNVSFLCLLQNVARSMSILFNVHKNNVVLKKTNNTKTKTKNHQTQTKLNQPETWKSNVNAGSLL